jgi:hypothetical protein
MSVAPSALRQLWSSARDDAIGSRVALVEWLQRDEQPGHIRRPAPPVKPTMFATAGSALTMSII